MFQFIHPFTLIIAGPSGSGKTTFIHKLIKNIDNLITTEKYLKVEKVVWCNTNRNAVPKNLNVEFNQGMPDDNMLQNDSHISTLIILDDLMTEAYNKKICELFTKGSHHRNLSVILITQNIFYQGKNCRDISLNAKYLVLFKNPRDQSQIFPLARQLNPKNSNQILKVYNEATAKPFGYLLFDLTQNINELFRYRTNIFQEGVFECYCNRDLLTSCDQNETIEGKQVYVTSTSQS